MRGCCMSVSGAVRVQYGCSMSTGCSWTIAEAVGSIPREFNQLQNLGGSPWNTLDVILGTVNPLVSGSNPSRGANFQKNLNYAAAYGPLDGVNSNRRHKTSPVRRRRAAAAIARRATPAEGRGAQRRVIRPGGAININIIIILGDIINPI